MGQLKVSDNAATTLASSLTSSPAVTSMTLVDASKFPVINHGGVGDDWSFVTLFDAANNHEEVRVTRRDNASNTLTILRGTAAGIEGVTDANCRAWGSTATGVACRLIAKVVNDISAAAAAAAASAAAAAASAASAVAGVKVTDNDTTADKLDDKITVVGALTKTVVNSGGNEQLQLGVNVPVTSVFGRAGAVTLNGADVTSALGYTPYNFGATTPYHTGNFNSGVVTGALGYTPWHPGNFDPATKASLSGPIFTGRVNLTYANPMLELHNPGVFSGALYVTGSVLYFGSTNGSGGSWTTLAQLNSSGTFTAQGNVVAYSDIKLKKDLDRITSALDKIDALTGYTFTRIDTGERQTGLIAQNVEAVLPEAVTRSEQDGTLGLAYGNLAGLFVEAIKELRAEIKALKEAA